MIDVEALGPRAPLCHAPTPLEPMDRLAASLGLPAGTLFVKRDDCTGLAGGGNKARKLEFLCGDALARGCDVLVTGGGRQSNHARMTAAAANRLGLDATLVLGGDAPDHPTGNVVLDQLLGADIVWAGPLDYYATEAAIEEACGRLEEAGRRPYAMPVGGASVVGALGYVLAGAELLRQDPDIDLVVVADGSGGTHAGLVAALGDHARVLGVDVGTRPDLDERVPEKAEEVAARAGLPGPAGRVRIDHERFAGTAPSTTSCAGSSTGRRAPRASCSIPSTRARPWPGWRRRWPTAGSGGASASCSCTRAARRRCSPRPTRGGSLRAGRPSVHPLRCRLQQEAADGQAPVEGVAHQLLPGQDASQGDLLVGDDTQPALGGVGGGGERVDGRDLEREVDAAHTGQVDGQAQQVGALRQRGQLPGEIERDVEA
ncbi:MAG TPA: pyridoxal-phosphate dependent enzyme, partial [Acidimicrobiales bacterium]|nr:pyridoxal-phosphate dependent enzyme [Acidimicrobiales bacterium]